MRVSWELEETTLFATGISDHGRSQFALVAEQLPQLPRWDWTVWKRGDAASIVHHGYALTALAAMSAAQQTARQMDNSAVTADTNLSSMGTTTT